MSVTRPNYSQQTGRVTKTKMKSGVQHDSFGTGVATTSVANVTGALNCFNGSDKNR